MPVLHPTDTSGPSNIVLDVYTRPEPLLPLTDMYSVEFQIWDCHTSGLLTTPTVLYPTNGDSSQWQAINVSGSDHLSTGRYVAEYTVPGGTAEGDYEIRWRFRLNINTPYSYARELFQVIQNPIGCSLSVTLDDITVSSAGTGAIQGSLSKTLDAITLVAADQAVIQGQLSKTIDDIVLSAASSAAAQGQLSVTLDAITLAATDREEVHCTLSTTLDPIALVATSLGTKFLSLDVTLNPLTLLAFNVSLKPQKDLDRIVRKLHWQEWQWYARRKKVQDGES